MAIHLVMAFIFARVTGKNRYFCDVPQQVLSEVVVSDIFFRRTIVRT